MIENPLTTDENSRLMEILGTMDIPPMRLDPIDSGWILRNIAIKNFEHPELAEAVALLRRVPRRGASR